MSNSPAEAKHISPIVVDRRLTEKGVQEDLLQQPQLMMKLVEKSLLVAENLRENYFRNTAHFIKDLRRTIDAANSGKRDTGIFKLLQSQMPPGRSSKRTS